MILIHPLHKLWRLFPPQQRRYFLSHVGAFFAPSIALNPSADNSVIIIGEFSKPSGLGEGARIMIQALIKNKIPVYQLDIDLYSYSLLKYREAYKILSAHPHATLILHINAPQIPFVLLNLPRSLLKNRKIIGYWAWELLILPKEWKIGFQFVHEIWVPSLFVAHAIKPWANKYNKPVKIIPHPIAEQSDSLSIPISREKLGLPSNLFIVLTSFNLASSFARKNPIGAIQAFKNACQTIPQGKICLVLKMTHIEHYQNDFKQIIQAVDNDPTILIYTKHLNREENKALTFHADIILSLHRSEGFGLVPAEAMLQGKPVIATNWSATTEFLDKSCGMPIDYSLIPANDPRMVYQIKNAYWADPNYNIAAKAINTLFYNENYRMTLGHLAQKKIKKYSNAMSLLNNLRNY